MEFPLYITYMMYESNCHRISLLAIKLNVQCIYRLTHSARRVLLGFTCTSSLTMNEKFQCRTRLCECGIENFEFIVSEQVMSALTFLLFQLTQKNRQTLSQLKPWGNDIGVLNLHHGYYTMKMTSRRLFCHNQVSRGTNQPIRKSEFVQCMKAEQ